MPYENQGLPLKYHTINTKKEFHLDFKHPYGALAVSSIPEPSPQLRKLSDFGLEIFICAYLLNM
jgi:hypothetical protein